MRENVTAVRGTSDPPPSADWSSIGNEDEGARYARNATTRAMHRKELKRGVGSPRAKKPRPGRGSKGMV